MEPFSPPLPVVVGHRGAPLRARENTPEAFALAAAEGATWVELDARRSSDGVVVVHHDPHTPDGVALVDRDAAELHTHGVHTLADVLAGLPAGLGVDVELKNLPGEPDFDGDDGLVELVADVLGPHLETRPLCTSSFNPATVAALAARLPDVPAGLLFLPTMSLSAAADYALGAGARLLCPHETCAGLDPEGVADVRARGLAILVWTVDGLERAAALADSGVDALCTNDPAGVVARLGRR